MSRAAAELLQDLRALGVTVAAEGERLRIKAPAGVLSDALKAALAEHKSAVLALLSEARAAGGDDPGPTRVSRDGVLPLSFAQQRLWFLDQLVPDGSVSNLALALDLDGPLDVAALGAALGDLAARHESLRTRFVDRDGVPAQVIAPPGVVALPWGEVPADSVDAGLAEARRQLQALRRVPFDLSAGPPWRARLLRLSERRHVLGLVLHHMVYDGWSLGVALHDLQALYAARVSGRASGLAELPLQYADYAVWQRRSLAGDARERLLEYWRCALAGVAPLDLPTDRPRPKLPAMRAAVHTLRLPRDLSSALTELGRESGATLFMTLLAAFDALLARCCGQDDIVVGSPHAGRTRAELEALVGPFLNLLVLRTDTSGDPTFRQLLARVADTCLAAWAHQALPFEQVVEALAPERDRSRNPLFQVNFVVQNAPSEAADPTGLSFRPLPVIQETTLFDLSVEIWERPEGLEVQFIHDTELYAGETIAQLGRSYRAVLEALVADPDVHLDALPLLSEADRRQLLVDANRTAAPPPPVDTLHAWVAAQAERTPDAVAVECDGDTLTYAELVERARRLGAHLAGLGAGPGRCVGLCVERGLPMLVGALGILESGAAYVPLDPAFPVDRLGFMLADCGASLLVTESGLRELLPDFAGTCVLLDGDAAQIAAAPARPAATPAAGPDDWAYVIYTSGSTGRPKGVCVPHRAVVNFLASMCREPGLCADDVLLAVTTLSFDIAGLELFAPLGVGARVVLASTAVAADGERLSALLHSSGATVCQATPTTWQLLLQSGWRDPRLKLLCGGEALPRSLADRLLEVGGELWNMYGPTETTIWSLTARLQPGDGRVPIGRPIANTRVYVLDARLRPVPQGVPGELFIGGDGVAAGYLGRPELTAERFVPDPFVEPPAGAERPRMYRTGDLVRRRADGQLEFVRRLDTQVKLRGYRIELGEIESVLAEHPAVAEAAVTLREDVPGDKRLVAYLTAVAGAAPDAQALRDWLSERVPAYMVPSAWMLLDDLPRTPNRKLDRQALPAPGGGRELGRQYSAPVGPMEQAIAEIWAPLLRVERVGRDDGFFELGGHSLNLMQARARLSERLGRAIPLADLFDAPTVAGLAARLAETTPEAGATGAILPVPRGDDVPVSFAQSRLWFLDQLDAGAAYNIPFSFEVQGPLDVGLLGEALDALVARHEALRTRFGVHAGRPRQHIAAHLHLPLAVEDRRGDDPGLVAEVLSRQAAREAQRPFDLGLGPLLRATLLRLPGERAVLFMTLHHIIADGWSIRLVQRELQELVRAAHTGEASRLPPLPVQYADWAAWQAEQLDDAALENLLDYWRGQLAGELTTLQLPLDRPRPAVQTFAGAAHGFALPDALTVALRRRCAELGVTPATLLLAAFNALLARYAGQDEVIVGAPVANRARPEVEHLIGFFVNSVVLRTDLSGDPTFAELVARVQRVSLAAYEHQDLPFERLVDELQPERSLSHNPLFQVVFALQNAPPPALSPGEVVLTPRPPEVSQTRTDLELHLLESAPDGDGHSSLAGWCVFNTGLFDRGTIERLAGHFVTLLEGAVAEPGRRISDLPLLDDGERRQVLHSWNDTALDALPDVCLHELIAARAAEAPAAVALSFGGVELTYAQLDARANRVAQVLAERGVGPDVLVGLCVPRSAEMIVGLLGILKAGGAYVPMDPTYPPERLDFMLTDSGVAELVTTAEVLAALPPTRAAAVRALCLDRDAGLLDAAPPRVPDSGVTPDQLAYVIYTSGSTGTPKGALLQHRGLVSLSAAQQRMFGVGPGDRVLQFSSLSFDAATFEIVMALASGATLCLGERGDLLPGPDLAAFLERQRISIVTLTPTALAALPRGESTGMELPALRIITVAGEACSAELVARWAPGRRFFNLYGPTETTIWATAAELTAADRAVHIGRPIANAQAYVLDAHGHPAPVGVPGELYLGGLGLARGYHRRPELSAERFVPHPLAGRAGIAADARLYKSGDRARWRPDGNLEFLGRLDHQIKLRGHRIELGEIEATLDSHAAVRESLALVREDAPGSRRLVAYVVPDPESDWDAEGELAADATGSIGAGETGLADVGLASDHVEHWRDLYEDTYAEAAQAADGTFNVSGWNSSYDGEPIDREQMRAWVELTVERVASYRPRRMLEIGCGSGLLLFRLAPRCELYAGTDFSAAAVQAVGAHLTALGDAAGRVELQACAAHEIGAHFGGRPERFDTLLINSVAQYFPGADYLLSVIGAALELLEDGGRLVLGDIRSLPLGWAFHASVQLSRAADDEACATVRRAALSAAHQDQELLIDPACFTALPGHFDRLGRVEVLPKPGRYDNELGRFRYDVVLHLKGGGSDAPGAATFVDWSSAGLDLAGLEARLRDDAPAQLAFSAIPNARCQADVLAADLLQRDDGPDRVVALRAEVAERLAARRAVHTEDLAELAARCGYTLVTSWAAGRHDGSFDAWLCRRDAPVPPPEFPRRTTPLASWAAGTNDPLRGRRWRELVPSLRRHAAGRLPEFMVPAAFVVLDAFPVTPNGKLDRDALPAPDALRPELAGDYVAPRTDAEQALARIWAEVLDLARVGADDNFFELGGDSILSIQLVAAARKAGLVFRARDLFEHQTVRSLARVAAVGGALAAEQGAVTGVVALTPIQHWFLDADPVDAQHFNQAFHLDVGVPLEVERLQRALDRLTDQHDALRLRFERGEDGWRQVLAAPGPCFPLTCVELAGLDADAAARRVVGAAEQAQAGLDLGAGPLARAVLFRAPDSPPSLLLVVHHLAVDAVSWRLLLEDLAAGLADDGAAPLPPKTTSWAAWSRALVAHAGTSALHDQARVWLGLPWSRAQPCPLDIAAPPADADQVGRVQTTRVSLEPDATRALLRAAADGQAVRVDEVLIAALARALAAWAGGEVVLLDLEGHGREELPGVDLSRTVGWFTTLFPVALELPAGADDAELLRSVSGQLRRLPEHGLPFGIGRHLADDAGLRADLAALPRPRVAFNYLGQLGAALSGSGVYRLTARPAGPMRSARQRRHHWLEVNAAVLDGRLEVEFHSSTGRHHAGTIAALAADFLAGLEQLVLGGATARAAQPGPADVGDFGWDQDELDDILEGLED